ALQDAGIKPPYILIGFSLGGFYIKAFARANPDDTEGLLLIDPLNTEAFYRDFKADFPDVYQWEAETYPPKEEDTNFHEGVFVFGDVFGNDSIPAHVPTILLISKKSSEKEIPEIPDLREKNRALQELWAQHLQQWAADYPLVKTIEVSDAGHYIHCSRMDVVLEAFNDLLQSIKN
ncbi:MAG: alpha/beta hydrolase, partial [Cyclobacteriaceae bacterium]|nr:alpha/beta hydrolase [Cyclobacteriaceae bacterium]